MNLKLLKANVLKNKVDRSLLVPQVQKLSGNLKLSLVMLHPLRPIKTSARVLGVFIGGISIVSLHVLA